MIRENQRLFNLLFFVIDISVITFSLMFAWFIRFKTPLLGFGSSIWGFDHYMLPLILILPIYIFLYYIFGLYQPKRTKSLQSEAIQILKVNFIGFLIFISALFIIDLTDYSRYLLAMFILFSTLFSIAERLILRLFLRLMRSRGYNIKYIILIGAGRLGEKVAFKFSEIEYMGFNIIGFLDDQLEKGHKIADSKVVGKIKDLEDIILKNQVDRVIITISPKHYKILEEIIDICEKYGVKADIVPDYYRYFPAKPYMDMIDDIPIIDIRYVPLDISFNRFIKRLMDFVFAACSIIILSPLLLTVALLVKISSPGPVIFKQERVGLNRKIFKMYKFRSMKVQNEDKAETLWTTEDDPRRTKLGTFIRKTSIDELPQLFNILKGDMSLIGPRPERPHFVEKFRDEIPQYMIKHHVRPGMTGWAQINGWRGNTSIKKRIEYDIYYVEKWNLLLDAKIFLLSLTRGFVNKNAY